jgi:1,4-dihydroxy-2-naphthoyl-CoA hydrolase
MSIWFEKNTDIQQLILLEKNTINEQLGIEWLEKGENFLKARMPVDHRTQQPFGLLHGGASCVLAETLGSVASYLVIDTSRFSCTGIEINANHLRQVRSGFVTGKASPLHIGRSIHVWEIKITDDEDKLVCVSRLTVAILRHPEHQDAKPASSTS